MGATSYAAIPYPELPSDPNVPADVQALAGRMDTILSLALGGGATIPGSALNLSAVPAQITTLNNTQSSQGGTLNTLTTRPYVQQGYYAQRTSVQAIGSLQAADVTVQTLSIPSQTYARALIVYMTSTWSWDQTETTNTLRSRMRVNGVDRTQVVQSGESVSLSAWHFETVAAGATTTVNQAINCTIANQTGQSATTTGQWPLIYALLFPWYGTAVNALPML